MKILIMKFRNIGDVLLTTPLIENIKYYFPESDIDFALNIGCEEMISGNPSINNIIIYDRLRIKKLGIFARLNEEIKFTRNIRSKNYDIVINLTEGDRGAQLTYLSGAKLKLGFPARKGILSKIGVYDKIGDDSEWQQMLQHTVEKDLQFINLLGKEVFLSDVCIHWSQDIDLEIDKILSENHVENFVHIHPVSRWMFKCWEADRMAKIIDYFEEEKNIKVLITGSSVKKEVDWIDQIIALCNTNPINLTGQLTLKHLASLSSKAKLFFGVDTAPMHIAAATNTPVLSIFGASFPAQWGPWNNDSSGQFFRNIDGVQNNGIHSIVSNMKQDIFFEKTIKKSKGMVMIDYDNVKSTLDRMI